MCLVKKYKIRSDRCGFYAVNNPIRYVDPDGMAIEDINGGVRLTGEDAVNFFKVIRQDQIEQKTKELVNAGKIKDAFYFLYDHIPELNKYLDRKHFDLTFDLSAAIGSKMITNGPYDVPGTGGKIAIITIFNQYFKNFANGIVEFADVVKSIYHEFVHVKQKLKLDGFKNNMPENELQFEAEYKTMLNKSLPQYKNIGNQNREHGWGAVRYLLQNNDPEIIKKYETQIKYILNNVVTPEAATLIKKEIEDRTGVKF